MPKNKRTNDRKSISEVKSGVKKIIQKNGRESWLKHFSSKPLEEIRTRYNDIIRNLDAQIDEDLHTYRTQGFNNYNQKSLLTWEWYKQMEKDEETVKGWVKHGEYAGYKDDEDNIEYIKKRIEESGLMEHP